MGRRQVTSHNFIAFTVFWGFFLFCYFVSKFITKKLNPYFARRQLPFLRIGLFGIQLN